jgi:hypothetical protein
VRGGRGRCRRITCIRGIAFTGAKSIERMNHA